MTIVSFIPFLRVFRWREACTLSIQAINFWANFIDYRRYLSLPGSWSAALLNGNSCRYLFRLGGGGGGRIKYVTYMVHLSWFKLQYVSSSGWDIAEWSELLTVLDSISASSDTVGSEGRLTKQCGLVSIKIPLKIQKIQFNALASPGHTWAGPSSEGFQAPGPCSAHLWSSREYTGRFRPLYRKKTIL